ncbi:MAG: nucleotidyl transferase AbiEii/AbiGii toxin family protein [Candidatus Moraniibacteriota bacterium]|nr:MAG: nucleotidyl transferase AbiEii/AbiGii toxin family protein [Candidatus Moranbacteria bacterium]
MYPETINHQTKCVFEKIKDIPLLERFYLAGGTALAIEIGHRISVDLDFFSLQRFEREKLKKYLSQKGSMTLVSEDEGTLHCILDGVKLSFLEYPYKMLFEFVEFSGIKLADERDIASMKIDAVSSRGSKKDFIDIYFLLKKYKLSEIIGCFEEKFSDIQYNTIHIYKSLVFFENADLEPMPVMIVPLDWEGVKKYITHEVMNMQEKSL